MKLKWYMSAAANPLLCNVDSEGEGEGGEGEGGAGGEGEGSGGEAEGGAGGESGKGGMREALGLGGKEEGKGVGDPPPAGTFDVQLLPEDMRGETPDETLAKLHKSWKGYRDAQAKNGAPEKPEDYVVSIAEDHKAYFPKLGEDPVMVAARKAAHEAGVPQDKFGKFMSGVTKALVDEGLVEAPINPETEIEALGGKDEAAKRLTAADAFADRLLATNKIDQEIADEMKLTAQTASGVKLIEFFMQRGEKSVGVGEDGGGGEQVTKETIRKDRQDPRYDTASPQYDETFRKAADARARQFHGG